MSQNVRTKTIASEELQEPTGPGTVAVESYADRLMDDLFEDVDRILVGGNHLPTESARSEYVSLKPITVPAIVMPPMTSPAELQKRAEAQETVEAKVVTTGNKQQDSNQWFDKWLLGAACGSLVIMLGLWLASRAQWQRMSAKAPAPAPSPIAPSPTISASDAKFANYVMASLDKIAQSRGEVGKTAAGRPTITAPAAQQQPQQQPTQQSTTINLPALPLSLNLSDATSLAQALNRLATALERVAIPTVNNARNQPPAPKPPVAKATPSAPKPAAAKSPTAKPSPTAAAASPTVKPSPAAAPSPAATASPTTAPSPTAAPSPTVVPSAAVTAFPEIQPQPAVPTLPPEIPAPTGEIPPPPLEPSAEPSVNATTLPSLDPAAIHTLVGILELGERSAALFEINGVARRVNIWESIGSSGWALVEVANQEAVIRRNGEVRSIYVGQKF